MKAFTLSAIFMFCSVGTEHIAAATLLLDDFSSGSFSLASGGTTSNSGAFASPLTNQRTVSGVGPANWAITLAPEELAYTVDQLTLLPRRNFFDLSYSKTVGTFSIIEFQAFAVDLFNVVGNGELLISVDGSAGRDIRVPINGSGTLVSPFSNLRTSQPLDSLSLINFSFIAVSEDFSLSIDNVRIVPEPSALLLSGVAAASLLFRRRRE
jgi:hypothetical protein